LGTSGGILGGLGALLGGLETVLGRHGSFGVVFEPTGSAGARHLGAQRGSKMKPKSDRIRTKIDVENELEKRRLLKIVLEPSWVDLGSSWVPSWGPNRALA